MVGSPILAMNQIDLLSLDFVTIFQERWLMIIAIVFLLIIYGVATEFRRFLVIVGLLLAFQLAWESINVMQIGFPFFSLHYTSPVHLELYIMNFPLSAVLLKTLIPLVSGYIFTSMATMKLVNSKMDMVKDRGKRISAHVGSRFLGAGVYVLMLIIIEPVLAAGDRWALGPYETFTNGLYFGTDPLYYLGSFATTAMSYTVVAILEARIGYEEEEVFFDYDRRVQTAVKYQITGFIVLTGSALIFSFLALFLDVVMGMIDLVIAIPCIFIIFMLLLYYSDVREAANINNFCNDNPSSFLCDL